MNNNFRRLGQHFLINKSITSIIVKAASLKANDAVIEIGPGKGSLTLPLVDKCKELKCKVLAIEKDQRLALLIAKNSKLETVEIIHGDILKELKTISSKFKKFKIVGNIPYYITGKLLRILSELENKPELIILTIQMEVAERIISRPPKMNVLAAITQFWSEPKLIAHLEPENFSPKPKVESAIITLKAKKQVFDPEKYYEFVKIIFQQPRKTIFNNLRFGTKLSKEKIVILLQKNNLTGTERPQNLDLDMLIKLARDYDKKNML